MAALSLIGQGVADCIGIGFSVVGFSSITNIEYRVNPKLEVNTDFYTNNQHQPKTHQKCCALKFIIHQSQTHCPQEINFNLACKIYHINEVIQDCQCNTEKSSTNVGTLSRT